MPNKIKISPSVEGVNGRLNFSNKTLAARWNESLAAGDATANI